MKCNQASYPRFVPINGRSKGCISMSIRCIQLGIYLPCQCSVAVRAGRDDSLTNLVAYSFISSIKSENDSAYSVRSLEPSNSILICDLCGRYLIIILNTTRRSDVYHGIILSRTHRLSLYTIHNYDSLHLRRSICIWIHLPVSADNIPEKRNDSISKEV